MAAMRLERRAVFGWPATSAPYAPCDQGLVVHYDGTDQGLAGKSHQACREYWKNTRKFHVNSRGWADIGYCVDEQTEILTADGWKTFREVKPGDIALTLNHESGMSEWQPIEDVYIFPAQPREMIRMEGRLHSSLTTPNHRWPVERFYRRTGTQRQKNADGTWKATGRAPRTVQGRERTWATTESLTYWDRIPIAAPPADLPVEPKWSDAFVELLAWFWTEGHIKPQSRSRQSSTGVAIYQSQKKNPENVARIRAALHQVFGPPVQAFPRTANTTDGIPRWREASNRHLVEFHLSVDAGRMLIEQAPNRVVRTSFLRQLTRAQLALFIEVSLLADGHNGAHSKQLSQKNRAAAEAFQIAAILAGYAASLRPKSPTSSTSTPMWTTTIRKQSFLYPRAAAQSNREFAIAREVYDGRIWCVRTPNGTWLARRAGTVYFTGNSFAVCPHGIVMEGRGWQRQQAAQPGGNSTWTSVTFMSGPSEAPTRAQINAFKQLRAWLRGKGLKAGIRGHRDFISTSCPGEKLYALVKNGGLAGPPEQRPEEEDDVPIRTSLGKTKPQDLAWGKWTRITWDVEHADPAKAHADGNYPGYIAPETSWADFHATVRVEGLAPGDEYQLRYEVHDWSGGKSTGDPWTEIHADHPATRGAQFVAGSCSKKLKKGQHAYVAIAVFPGDGGGRPAPKAVSGRWTIRQDKP